VNEFKLNWNHRKSNLISVLENAIDSSRSKLRGIIDPLYIFFIVLANPEASYGDPPSAG
jgi:hypothetical protein